MAYRDYVLDDNPYVYLEITEAVAPGQTFIPNGYLDTTGRARVSRSNTAPSLRQTGFAQGIYAAGFSEGNTANIILDRYIMTVGVEYAFGVWISSTRQAVSGNCYFIMKDDPSASCSYACLFESGSQSPTHRVQIDNVVYKVDAQINICDGGYHFVVGVKDKDYIYIYVDGIFRGKTAVPNNRKPDFTSGEFFVGSLTGYTNPPFVGNLAQVSIYDHALSATQVQRQYNAGVGGLGMKSLGGTALLNGGGAASRVEVRRFSDGRFVDIVVPASNGEWSMAVVDGSYLITAIGPDGYQPVTHGPVTAV